MGWTRLPDGQDLTIPQGGYVAVVASIGRGMSEADVRSHVPVGVDVLSYAQRGPDALNGKTIAVVAHARAWSGDLSWSRSILWSTLYTLTEAYAAPAGSAPSDPPPWSGSSASSVRRGVSVWSWPWVLGTIALVGAGVGLARWRKARR